ncbi:tryptophan 7-halogenase [Paraglaciecola aquimarina]|uniref:Tryptophan 7-halogenase n=1 Tax=Paraglaciecola aquimarina TaxID=1235557 RepID=A0ABU3SRU4_9ALTE|nr:tryptophan 7-halogenase [Paraglaciecola aquimarina]MDU0352738.1 tryptophan 7-halogenase [Paraglaciecola aquimarina]
MNKNQAQTRKPASTTASQNLDIVIYGHSIAAFVSALTIHNALAGRVTLSLILPADQTHSDILYGGTATPDAYNLHLAMGITEAQLLQHTNSSFSFGTHYQNWTDKKFDWIQAFNLPFTSKLGIDFHQVLLKHNQDIQPYLAGAQSALQHKFAHPPQNQPALPLSRAEYGYNFDYQNYALFLLNEIIQRKINLIQSDLLEVEVEDEHIARLRLNDDSSIEADLFIDCSGPDAKLISALDVKKQGDSRINVSLLTHENDRKMKPCNQISGHGDSWQSTLYLQDSSQVLQAVSDKDASEKVEHSVNSVTSISVNIGYQEQAWVGNCVAMSLSAAVLEPFSNAPFRLLKLDIERLLELIPISNNMQLEQKEYNRRYKLDVQHAALFNLALTDTRHVLQDSHAKKNQLIDSETQALLDRKLVQYLHRGLIVSYDLEPFYAEDWVILHFGMQRFPRRLNSLCDNIDNTGVKQHLLQTQNAIAAMVAKMPPCSLYTEKFLNYLKRQA